MAPIADSAKLSSEIVKVAMLKLYKGSPQACPPALKNQINADLLEFINTKQFRERSF
jgi:hypothetical protein